jgi:hypothetical protein
MKRLVKALAWMAVLAVPVTGSAQVVISEFRCRGPAGGNDEFVEIYNAGTETVDVGGWRLMAATPRNGGPAGDDPPGDHDAPRTFLLFVNKASGGYSGAVAGTCPTRPALRQRRDRPHRCRGQPGGQVGLASGSAYKEGTTLTAFSSTNKDQSYERKSATCGPDQDTGDNAADFEYAIHLLPRNSWSCRPFCAGDLCSACRPRPAWTSGPSMTSINGPAFQRRFAFYCEYTQCPRPAPSDAPAAGAGPLPAGPLRRRDLRHPPQTTSASSHRTCSGGVCDYAMLPPESPCNDGDSVPRTTPATPRDLWRHAADLPPAGTRVPGRRRWSPGFTSPPPASRHGDLRGHLAGHDVHLRVRVPPPASARTTPAPEWSATPHQTAQCYQATGSAWTEPASTAPWPPRSPATTATRAPTRTAATAPATAPERPGSAPRPDAQCTRRRDPAWTGPAATPPGSRNPCDDGDLCTDGVACTEGTAPAAPGSARCRRPSAWTPPRREWASRRPAIRPTGPAGDQRDIDCKAAGCGRPPACAPPTR